MGLGHTAEWGSPHRDSLRVCQELGASCQLRAQGRGQELVSWFICLLYSAGPQWVLCSLDTDLFEVHTEVPQTGTAMVMEALLTMALNWKLPKCPSAAEWTHK